MRTLTFALIQIRSQITCQSILIRQNIVETVCYPLLVMVGTEDVDGVDVHCWKKEGRKEGMPIANKTDSSRILSLICCRVCFVPPTHPILSTLTFMTHHHLQKIHIWIGRQFRFNMRNLFKHYMIPIERQMKCLFAATSSL